MSSYERLRRRPMPLFAVVAAASISVIGAVAADSQGAATTGAPVVVARGNPIQIAVLLDQSTPIGAFFTEGIQNAIRMAVDARPVIRGHPVQLHDFDAPCGAFADVGATDVAVAKAVTADLQNVGAIGQMCSEAFAGPNCPDSLVTPLSIYEGAGIVTISGSGTAPCLSQVGPTVFNRTTVADPGFGPWYATVQELPSDIAWVEAYTLRFGKAPTPFADLYFDAAGVLLKQLQRSSHPTGGSLLIDRAALAAAVRNTTHYEGVTCTVTLDPATGNRVDDPVALSRCASGADEDVSDD